jgi:ABC-type multidrug transport system ATPase subunit
MHLSLFILQSLIFHRYLGMLEPTSGSVVVEGFDYKTHNQEIRKLIGFCPQYGE